MSDAWQALAFPWRSVGTRETPAPSRITWPVGGAWHFSGDDIRAGDIIPLMKVAKSVCTEPGEREGCWYGMLPSVWFTGRLQKELRPPIGRVLKGWWERGRLGGQKRVEFRAGAEKT